MNKNKTNKVSGVEIEYDENTGIAKLAQNSPNQTQPLDVVEEQDRVNEGESRLDIPRDESVGLKQTQPKEVQVFKVDFEMGENGSDTNIVPRSSNDDGIGGKKVTFEEEKAKDYSSGNPDSYVQDLQDRSAPTSSGDPKNRAVVAKKEESLMKRIAELEKEVKEANKALNEERLYRDRERVVREILQVEAEKGISSYTKAEANAIVEARIKHPIDILEHDLERIKSLPSVSASSNLGIKESAKTFKTGFEYSGGLQTSIPTSPNVQEDLYRTASNLSELQMHTNNRDNRIASLKKELSKHSSLSRQFSDENVKELEKARRL